MKAILVDPVSQTVSGLELEHKEGGLNLAEVNGYLRCDTFTTVMFPKRDHLLLVDDVGALSLPQPKTPWVFEYYPDPLYGRAIVLGLAIGTGNERDVSMSVEDMEVLVKWLPPKILEKYNFRDVEH